MTNAYSNDPDRLSGDPSTPARPAGSEPGSPLPGLLAVPDVQAVFARSARTIRRWIHLGHLTPLRIGGAVFFRAADIQRLVAGDLRTALTAADSASPDSGQVIDNA